MESSRGLSTYAYLLLTGSNNIVSLLEDFFKNEGGRTIHGEAGDRDGRGICQ